MGTTIACIGSGNMGHALMKGMAGRAVGLSVGFADPDGEKAKAAAAELGGEAYASNTEAVEKGDYVFLAVKPRVLEEVLAGIAPAVRKRKEAGDVPVLVSMAAGWGIEKIRAAVGGTGADLPVVRIMPNTPSLISKGMIALAAPPEVPREKTAELETMLRGAGTVVRLSEKELDAATGLSGSGPAYAYMFIEALADGGVLAGLPRDTALRLAAGTLLGSAAMVLESGRHPGELKDMVCSPGGTTIAGVSALEAGAFRSTVIKAVEASWRRAREMSGGE